jgi:outer membrane receptor for ferrienterochelin and colicins
VLRAASKSEALPRLLGEGLTLSAAVYNLLDKKVEQTDFNTVMEGRRFWMSLTTTF